MNILGILAVYVGIFIGNTTRFKRRKDYISIFELNVVIMSAKDWGDNNSNNFDDDDNHKKIKIFKPNKYHSKKEKFKF